MRSRSTSRARCPRPELAGQLVAPVAAAVTCAWVLTAFPVYPPAWTAPIAIILGTLAWKRPFAAGCVLAAVAVPALWNQAEASALLFARGRDPLAAGRPQVGRPHVGAAGRRAARADRHRAGDRARRRDGADTAPACAGRRRGRPAGDRGRRHDACVGDPVAGRARTTRCPPSRHCWPPPRSLVLVLACAVFAPLLHETVRAARRPPRTGAGAVDARLRAVHRRSPAGLRQPRCSPCSQRRSQLCSPVYWRLAGPSSRLASRSAASRHGRRPYPPSHPPTADERATELRA